MTTEASAKEESFNLEKLKELLALMEQHGLSEVDLRSANQRWKLRRGPAEVHSAPPAYASYPPPGYPNFAQPAAPAPVSAPPAAAAAAPADEGIPIKSPTVGTFYTATAPGEPPFVSVGSKVNKDTVVCIIEAMKVFNQITADVSGTITKVLVNNGDAVDFNQPMYLVRLG
jgi:acetyl-CoA carboxylase biotin carboxyl carrier protein